MKSIAQTLREAREQRQLSLRDLADLCGVSAASISRLENGFENVTLDLMRSLTDALQLDIEMWFAAPLTTTYTINFPLFQCYSNKACDPIVVTVRGVA